MLFTDHLHGTIDFRGTPYADLIYELLGCPEVQRLRHMRLMNFDVPYIQDLASTKRLPHSIGTCFLAYKIVENSALKLSDKKKIIVAALIHDIGILPFGHLLESTIKSYNKDFSHEKLVYSILTGTYHVTNLYHQILGSESLRLHKVLKENHIKSDDIFHLVCPQNGNKTAISADIDVDNLDNVHRMANLLGYEKAKSNLNMISENVVIDNALQLTFNDECEEWIEAWLKMRQSIYTMIIGHPECVPYNAFLSKLLSEAVESEVITENEWYITDSEFESRLISDKKTKALASWLLVRPHFELIDYAWLMSNEKPGKNLKDLEKLIRDKKLANPHRTHFYFFWTESKLISREVSVKFADDQYRQIGYNSYSILVSIIAKSGYGLKAVKVPDSERILWRKDLLSYVAEVLPDWQFTVKFPSDYNDSFFNSKIMDEQLKLFK